MRKSITIIPKFFLVAWLLMLVNIPAWAQNAITGTVTDAKDGSPVPGVTVTIKGTTSSTQTDASGNFRISAASSNVTLVFSSVGFGTKEVAVAGQTAVSVSLTQFNQQLNEVVVVGYGTARRRDLTGAVTVVSSKDFQKGAITTPEQLIAGKVAGVSITNNGGAPGAGSTIRIRGGSSLNASNDPLIVIDGVPLDNGGISGASNALALINPNDIETFNILKDASATAIYGSRASNGVIIITTKKGVAGKTKINFNTQVQVSKIAKKVDVLSASEFRNYVNNDRESQTYAPLMGNASTDWQDEIYQTAISNDNNLSFSGSINKSIPYRVSIGYLTQEGILRTGKLERGTVGINLSPRFMNNHLKVDINVKGSLTGSRFANEGAIGSAALFDPTQPVYSGSKRYGGFWEWLDPSAQTGLRALSPRNPVGLLEMRDDRSLVKRSIGNIVFDYKFHFLPDLRANLNLGYDVARGTGNIIINDSAAMTYNRFPDAGGLPHGGVNNQYRQERNNRLMEFYLNYVKELKSAHSRIDLTAGYSYNDFKTINYNFADRTFDKTIVSVPLFRVDKPQYTLISVYGRLNYSFMNRYLLTATIRRDGSSRFNEDNRWGNFPSVALAWRIKEESFLKDSRLFSDLKLRASYGITGQQDGIGYFDYITYYTLSNNSASYQLGNTFYNMYRPNGYYANRRWEETATTNVGLDFGFKNNRITGSIEAYLNKTSYLLNEIDQPAGTNFSNKIVANVGNMENKGIEFNINADVIKKDDLVWSVGFNATYNKNKITKLTIANNPGFQGNEFGGVSGGTGTTLFINTVDYPRASYYVYQQVYDESGNPIDGMYEDLNRDGIVNSSDRYRYKSPAPEMFFGFTTNVNYKKWTAGFVLRANLNNYVYNNINAVNGVRSAVFGNSYLNNAYGDLLNTGFSGTKAGFSLSDYFIENASFLRMDNLNVGYDFGKILRGKSHMRLNFNVQNVFVITKYSGLDPEIQGGVDNNFYPRPRVFVLGANFDF